MFPVLSFLRLWKHREDLEMNVYTSLPYNVENSEVFRMVYEEIVFGSSTGFGVVICDPRRLVAAVARCPRLGDPVLGSVLSACRRQS